MPSIKQTYLLKLGKAVKLGQVWEGPHAEKWKALYRYFAQQVNQLRQKIFIMEFHWSRWVTTLSALMNFYARKLQSKKVQKSQCSFISVLNEGLKRFPNILCSTCFAWKSVYRPYPYLYVNVHIFYICISSKKLLFFAVYLTMLKIPTSTTHKRQFTAAAYNDVFQW